MFHLRINVAVMCIVMLLATTVDAGIFKPRNLGVLGRYKQQYKVKLIKREANEFFQRVPDALVKSFVEYSKVRLSCYGATGCAHLYHLGIRFNFSYDDARLDLKLCSKYQFILL